jgi:flavin reductase
MRLLSILKLFRAYEWDGAMTQVEEFLPSTANTFRSMWRGVGATVTLVATEQDGHFHAMLATSVASVSVDPPSILVCLNREASSYPAVLARAAFSLNLLAEADLETGRHVAKTSGSTRFSKGEWQRLHRKGSFCNGIPWLKGAQATAFCRIDRSLEYNTHSVFIARVEEMFDSGHRTPLLYCDGRYGRFESLV